MLDARTFASILATEKIEQLRSLVPTCAAGPLSLSADVAGACDFIDQYGRSWHGFKPVAGDGLHPPLVG